MARIMVVDDEIEIARILHEFLEKKGYKVVSFSYPEKALRHLLADSDFDLLITDMKMPKLRGLDFLASLKEKGIAIPAIILTGSIDAEKFKDEFISFGLIMDDVAYKPIDLSELLEKIKTKLKGS